MSILIKLYFCLVLKQTLAFSSPCRPLRPAIPYPTEIPKIPFHLPKILEHFIRKYPMETGTIKFSEE